MLVRVSQAQRWRHLAPALRMSRALRLMIYLIIGYFAIMLVPCIFRRREPNLTDVIVDVFLPCNRPCSSWMRTPPMDLNGFWTLVFKTKSTISFCTGPLMPPQTIGQSTAIRTMTIGERCPCTQQLILDAAVSKLMCGLLVVCYTWGTDGCR